MNDSLNMVSINKQLTEMQTKYETEKKETEIKLLNSENEHKKALIARQQTIGFAIAGSLILVIILAVVFFNGRRKQRKANELLTIQNTTISQQNDAIKTQNDEIKAQNDEITLQKQIIEISHQNITSSITYASKIQQALLPQLDILDKWFPEYFVLFKPRDIVSGDFYFVKQIKNQLLIAAADCTGHGVPGAFMSMLGIAILNEVTQKIEIQNASQVLNDLRKQLKFSLQQTGKTGEQQDGMDIAFCSINMETLEMSFAGAYNPCWIFRNEMQIENDKKLVILDADRQPVGVYLKEKSFTEQKFQLQKGDTFYVFSDGYLS